VAERLTDPRKTAPTFRLIVAVVSQYVPGDPILGVRSLPMFANNVKAKGVPGSIVAKIKLLRPMGVWS